MSTEHPESTRHSLIEHIVEETTPGRMNRGGTSRLSQASLRIDGRAHRATKSRHGGSTNLSITRHYLIPKFVRAKSYMLQAGGKGLLP